MTPRCVHKTKIVARDTIFLDLMEVVKVRDAPYPKCIKTRILEFLPEIK